MRDFNRLTDDVVIFQQAEWVGLYMSRPLTPKKIKEHLKGQGVKFTKSDLKKITFYAKKSSNYFDHMMSLDDMCCRPKGEKWYKPENLKEIVDFKGVL